MNRFFCKLSLLVCLAGVLALTGCGKKTGEVTGTVTFNGKPLPVGKIVFSKGKGRTGSGTTAAKGNHKAGLTGHAGRAKSGSAALGQRGGRTGGTMLAHAGTEHNIDEDLLASVVRAESGGNARAVSRAGAQGLMPSAGCGPSSRRPWPPAASGCRRPGMASLDERGSAARPGK